MPCSNCGNPDFDEDSGERCIQCGSYGFVVGSDPELDAYEIRRLLDREEAAKKPKNIPEENRNQRRESD
jgi:hypothetical protein